MREAELNAKLERLEELLVNRQAEFLDLEGCCTLLGLKKDTIYGYVHKGVIPHMKLGSRLRFDRNEIVAWVRARRVKTNEELENG